jgi:hypothetical protein
VLNISEIRNVLTGGNKLLRHTYIFVLLIVHTPKPTTLYEEEYSSFFVAYLFLLCFFPATSTQEPARQKNNSQF